MKKDGILYRREQRYKLVLYNTEKVNYTSDFGGAHLNAERFLTKKLPRYHKKFYLTIILLFRCILPFRSPISAEQNQIYIFIVDACQQPNFSLQKVNELNWTVWRINTKDFFLSRQLIVLFDVF